MVTQRVIPLTRPSTRCVLTNNGKLQVQGGPRRAEPREIHFRAPSSPIEKVAAHKLK